MKREVLIAVSGLQVEIDQEEPVEVISAGKYCKRNGTHYISYEEAVEGDDFEEGGIIRNLLKVSPNRVEMSKKGYSNVSMLFETGKKTMSCYNTPFGNMMVGVDTMDVTVVERKEGLVVLILYALDVNYEHISDCRITIKVVERN